jgi:hypothetical protein
MQQGRAGWVFSGIACLNPKYLDIGFWSSIKFFVSTMKMVAFIYHISSSWLARRLIIWNDEDFESLNKLKTWKIENFDFFLKKSQLFLILNFFFDILKAKKLKFCIKYFWIPIPIPKSKFKKKSDEGYFGEESLEVFIHRYTDGKLKFRKLSF